MQNESIRALFQDAIDEARRRRGHHLGYIAVSTMADVPAALDALGPGVHLPVKLYLGGISPDDWDNDYAEQIN